MRLKKTLLLLTTLNAVPFNMMVFEPIIRGSITTRLFMFLLYVPSLFLTKFVILFLFSSLYRGQRRPCSLLRCLSEDATFSPHRWRGRGVCAAVSVHPLLPHPLTHSHPLLQTPHRQRECHRLPRCCFQLSR